MRGDSNGFLMTQAPIMESRPSPGCQLQPRQETLTRGGALVDGLPADPGGSLIRVTPAGGQTGEPRKAPAAEVAPSSPRETASVYPLACPEVRYLRSEPG